LRLGDGRPVSTTPVNCGVLFALSLAVALRQLPEGVSYVDDCSWVVSFNAQSDFKREAVGLLEQVRAVLLEYGFTVGGAKTEVAFGKRGKGRSADTSLGDVT